MGLEVHVERKRFVVVAVGGACVASIWALASCVGDTADKPPPDSGTSDVQAFDSGVDAANDAAADAQQDAVGDAGCDLAKPFIKASVTNISSAQSEDGMWVLPNQTKAYVSAIRDGGGGDYDIFNVTRSSAAVDWPALTPSPNLNPLITTAPQRNPLVTDDDLVMLYSQQGGNFDIMQTTRPSIATSWTTPVAAPGLNGTTNDSVTWLSGDGLAVYWSSDRNGNFDLFYATRTNVAATFTNIQTVNDLNSPSGEGSLVVTSDGLRAYFASNRSPSANDDIWTSTRPTKNSPWSTPVAVTELNGPSGNQEPTWVSADGCTLYYAQSGAGGYDLFVATKPPK